MKTSWLAAITLLACGCAVQAASEPPSTSVSAQEPPGAAGPDYAGPPGHAPPDPCTYQMLGYDGHVMTVSIPCAQHARDTGDPPPERAGVAAKDATSAPVDGPAR